MTSKQLSPPVWVDEPDQLEQLAGQLKHQKQVAVDTESNSLHAYREQVCLIQLSTPENDYVIDPLAITDLSALGTIFANPKIEKVFHAAEYDLICLRRDYHFEVENIFDTMQAARILAYPQVGLNAILAQKFDISVNKHFQKANWAQRPLPNDLLNYAREDTHYLSALRNILHNELKKAHHWALAHEEFIRISHAEIEPGTVAAPWQRISNTRTLTRRQMAILQELSLWREKQAEQMNRPVFKVINDSTLVALAQANPGTYEELEKAGLSQRQRSTFGNDLLRAIQRGKTAAPILHPYKKRPEKSFLNRLKVLQEWRKSTAQADKLESDIILPKAFMQAIAEYNPRDKKGLITCMTDSPWRVKKYGAAILRVIKEM